MFEGRFSGRSAVITGGASGLGRQVATRILAEGGKVALLDQDRTLLAATAEAIGAQFTVDLDVSDPAGVADGMAACREALGAIDILICGAGITGPTQPVADYPIEGWQQVMSVNLNGVFFCCRAALPFMQQQGYGRIVNVASVAGKEGNPNASAYSASKAAVIAFTKSLAKEVATAGIIANAIAPATFQSPILDQLPQSHIDYMRSRIPMNRLGTPDENAAMICFMASEECSFTTGAVFDTSGGRCTY
jgi:NAD(P)-dependent dehydrogenase (short-subunit alcohol dehydrogenase family)